MKAYYRETENSIFKNLLWLHCYGAGVGGDWSYIEQDDQGSRPRHNTVSQKLDKLQLPCWARLEFPGRSSTVTTHFAAHTRQAHHCNPQLRSRRDPRWTLLLFYYNILTATVTFIDWCIYLMIIRRRSLFKQNITKYSCQINCIAIHSTFMTPPLARRGSRAELEPAGDWMIS